MLKNKPLIFSLTLLSGLSVSSASFAEEADSADSIDYILGDFWSYLASDSAETQTAQAGEDDLFTFDGADVEPVFALPPVEVIGTTPVLGSGLPKEKVPANVQVIGQEQIDNSRALNLGDLLNSQGTSFTLNDAQNNPFQPDIHFRGYTASPLLGNPEGIAIYQNGIRINEPFGDVVQWDVIPEFALNSVQIIPGANPVYGLNALGGALALEMKNGYNFQGFNLDGYAGSFGRGQITSEYGGMYDDWAMYVGVTGFEEYGWRDHSESNLQQAYGDVRTRGENYEVAFNVSLAKTDLNGNGVTPLQLLKQDRAAVFTFPDNTQNKLGLISMQGNYEVSEALSFQTNAYGRHLRRETLNGDEFEAEACGDNANALCSEDGNVSDGDEIRTEGGGTIDPTTLPSEGINGANNTSHTFSNSTGLSLQATLDQAFLEHENNLVLGGSVDYGHVQYSNRTEIGYLNAARGVEDLNIYLGGSAYSSNLEAQNIYAAAFFTDTVNLVEGLDLTVSGRFNWANINLGDNLGTSLNGDHYFRRFNPAAGLTYQLADNITTYGSYSEANRVPTAVELSCADPAEPCRVPNAFLADPPLEQVVNRSVEVGARGGFDFAALGQNGKIDWNVAGFGSKNWDDIIFVSGSLVGTGYFKNAGMTRRIGAEAGVNGILGPFSWYLSYSFVEATFQSNPQLPGQNHPDAVGGSIQVSPGDRIPGIPLHTGKVGVGYNITDRWSIGVDTIINSEQYYRGDESNQLGQVHGYAVVNLQSSYQVADFLKAHVKVNNLLDREYETFGLLGNAEEVLGDEFYNTRFLGPGAPIGVWGGMTLSW